MEVEVSAEAKDRRLNRMVAVTVVLLSVFTGLCNIKDGNIVQAMQQAKADSVDRWGEYQATKTKLHIAETARGEIAILAGGHPSAEAQAAMQRLDGDVAKYKAEAPLLAQQAKGLAGTYDALNVHDDQFDASEAFIATAISMAAVSALAESFWVLAAAWAIGGFGLFMGLCGFLGWGFHPDVLSTLLG
jgi:fructose-bisphosphate aldolase class 1